MTSNLLSLLLPLPPPQPLSSPVLVVIVVIDNYGRERPLSDPPYPRPPPPPRRPWDRPFRPYRQRPERRRRIGRRGGTHYYHLYAPAVAVVVTDLVISGQRLWLAPYPCPPSCRRRRRSHPQDVGKGYSRLSPRYDRNGKSSDGIKRGRGEGETFLPLLLPSSSPYRIGIRIERRRRQK